jgi:hypothetical protein
LSFRLEMDSITNAISLSVADIVGSVAGFLNVFNYTISEPPPCYCVIL